MNINQQVMGMPMSILMDISAQMSYTVNSFTDGAYDVKVKYDAMKMGIKSGQGSIEFGSIIDSAMNAIQSPLDSIMSALTKVSFNMSVTPAGKVTAVTGLDNIFEELFNQFGSLSEMEKAQMRAQIEETYGSEALKNSFEQSFVFLPENDVAVGETWEVNSTISGQFPVKVNGKYSLKSINDTSYVISNEANIVMSGDEPVAARGIEMKMDITGTMKGDIVISRESGWILYSDVDQNFKGKVMVDPTENLPTGMEMPIEFSNRMTINGN